MSSLPEPQLGSLYQQLILEHYRKPKNKGELPERTVDVQLANPVCGDEIHLQLQIEGDTIVDARFLGQGCAISQSAVSMMTQKLKGAEISEGEALARRFTELMHGDEEAGRDRSLGDLRALKGVSKFPVRIKCALLAFDALQEALKKSAGGAEGNEGGDEVAGRTGAEDSENARRGAES